jgi:hypothetical protein
MSFETRRPVIGGTDARAAIDHQNGARAVNWIVSVQRTQVMNRVTGMTIRRTLQKRGTETER